MGKTRILILISAITILAAVLLIAYGVRGQINKKSAANSIDMEEASENKELPEIEFTVGGEIVEAEPEEKDDDRASDTEDSEKDSTQQESVPKSDYRILIDPGHYAGANEFTGADGLSYSEGDYTIEIALHLQEILLEKYGIQADLTRTNGSITINGYSNQALDRGHIALRGEASEGYDLFISIHTNANNDGANGYGTTEQPTSINKAIVLLNTVALEDENAIAIANEVGGCITNLYQDLNLPEDVSFKRVENGAEITQWTDVKNDALGTAGTLYIRTDEEGDYYGVLRGATSVGTSGMIIEHGFHTVPEFRDLMRNEDLAERLAEADAEGIARGLGIIE